MWRRERLVRGRRVHTPPAPALPRPAWLPCVPGRSSAACPPPRPGSWYSRWAPRPSAGRPAAPGPACAGCEGETFRASGPWGGTQPRARYHRGSGHSPLCLLGKWAPNPAGTRAGPPTRAVLAAGPEGQTVVGKNTAQGLAEHGLSPRLPHQHRDPALPGWPEDCQAWGGESPCRPQGLAGAAVGMGPSP